MGINYLEVKDISSTKKNRVVLFYLITFSISFVLILFTLRRMVFLSNMIQNPAFSMMMCAIFPFTKYGKVAYLSKV